MPAGRQCTTLVNSVIIEKIFSPGRWFVLFCALLVTIWLSLQWITATRLTVEAKEAGQHIFAWTWPRLHLCSQVVITTTKVVHEGPNDATVVVSGQQSISSPGIHVSNTQTVCAKLTFYKTNNCWILGSVEFK